MTYIPKPIDTSTVQLSPNIEDLQERLAENAHEIWSQQRIADGWTLGQERNDARKEHPGLIPYDELADSEKEYDRVMVRAVLKTILAMGYEISSKHQS